VWLLFIERRPPKVSRPRHGGLLTGACLGLLIGLIIVAAYFLIGGDMIDREQIRAIASRSGFATPARFAMLGVYFCTVNALMEEYVWRWFVFRQWQTLTKGSFAGTLSIVLTAACFTIHHVVVLAAQFDPAVVWLGSAGVFTGGAVWSWCYLRFSSIWPGHISHAIVDVAVMTVGALILFG